MPDERPGPMWSVVDIQQTTRVTPAGRFEEVYEYTVDTAWGTTFQVQVPVSVHSAEIAKDAIEAQALALAQGIGLSG